MDVCNPLQPLSSGQIFLQIFLFLSLPFNFQPGVLMAAADVACSLLPHNIRSASDVIWGVVPDSSV